MRIALTGALGQLGTALRSILPDEVVPLRHRDLDITDAGHLTAKLDEIRPELVINAAADNFVDRAEDEPQAAFAVNALGPRNLALWCQESEASLLHVSTDYVFGLDARRQTPYHEADVPGPVSAYGTSKLAGEYFVRAICPRSFVVRTCGLYGRRETAGKGSFVETILRLCEERDTLNVVDDQHCTPSSAVDVARAIAALIETEVYGLYHATNTGSTTWYGMARESCRVAGLRVTVNPTTSQEFGAKAQRPPYSVLDNSKLSAAIGLELPPWQEALAAYLSDRVS